MVHLLVHSELDRVGPWLGPQVVHSGLQALLPRVKVHRRQLALQLTQSRVRPSIIHVNAQIF